MTRITELKGLRLAEACSLNNIPLRLSAQEKRTKLSAIIDEGRAVVLQRSDAECLARCSWRVLIDAAMGY